MPQVSLARGATRAPHRAARGESAGRPAPARQVSAQYQPVESLTPREVEVVQTLATGLSTPEISAKLGITRNTLRTHVHNIMGKLGARSKLEAVLAAIRLGIVEPPRPADRRH
jgi:DNA-binding CsgD family transcriptional regulator